MRATMAPSQSKHKTASWGPLQRFFGNGADAVRGAVAVEFGLVATILVALTVCTADLGLGFYRYMQVQNAAQAGAQYAILRGYSSTAISSAVTNATTFSGISANP